MDVPQIESLPKPIIGVFMISKNKLFNKGPLNSYNLLNEANERTKATLYFFTRKNVDIARKLINGYIYDKESGQWIQKVFPYPDVLYSRNVNMDNKKYNYIRDSFRKEKVIFLNPVGRLDKWDQYKIFNENHTLKKYLPDTVSFSKENLRTMLNRYKEVYVKGTRSGQGKHVIQVIQTLDNKFQCRYYKSELITYTTDSLVKVIERLKKILNGKEAIIQKKIESLNRKVDLRVETQRNKHNNIEIVGAAVRVGDKKIPILNTRSQPTIYNLENFFSEQLHYSRKELQSLQQELTTLVKAVFLTLEEKYGTFVEMGIDIMLDQNYDLYLIESNATPGRTSIYRGCGLESVSKAYSNVLEYIKWLTQDKLNGS
ncbi:YheC/YheD family protein [Bacillus rhizoplanae]|uniref:YheC/YheD family protein n=1 Tax=Bacillus rhizoplanae TaxID=2880966 RepID=UPI003D1C9E2B